MFGLSTPPENPESPISFTAALIACSSEASSNADDPDFIDQRGWLFPTDPIISTQLRNLWQQTLLGCFVDNRSFSEATIQSVVDTFWHTKGPVMVEKRSGVFCFHFEDQYDLECILSEQPWNVHGAVLVLQPWKPNTILPQLQFPSMDVWVQAHNIPIECFYSDLANLLGHAAGHLLQMDWSYDRTRSLDFFRFQVRIHTDEPLILGAFIELLEGDFHWISFRYEKTFRICYRCGKIGHTNSTCKSSLMEAFESLHQRYDQSSFSQSFPLSLANNKPMFTPSLRAFRNTDCNRTTRIWVLYEEEVQNMEMDQNLIFNVDVSDSHSTDDVFHTPDEGSSPMVEPIPHPTPVKEGDPPPAQGSSFFGNLVHSFLSPLSPSLVNPLTPLHVPVSTTSPLPVDESMGTDQTLTIEPIAPMSLHGVTSTVTPPILTSSSDPMIEEAQHSPIHPLIPHAISNPETKAKKTLLPFTNNANPSLSPISQPLTVPEPNLKHSSITEVFRCSAPDFNGDDAPVVLDSQSVSPGEASINLYLSNAIQQQSLVPKKRSSSSSDSGSSRGGKRSKLVLLNQREQPPGLQFNKNQRDKLDADTLSWHQ
ncbi:hypothetical protein RHMOL_Rhmol12G0118200 [Rhododendron molle]|uniref:Uncharacterized protein n=1 Tax=Rhododendron molle TaxID=49168 RepID=A0ACC0LHF6_RHOML|nr:hypothetical protein RHMOL_Rhmol12G0118200 [Rhododendron molle]